MEILGKNYELKYGLRAQFIFEGITNKSFEIKTTMDQYILFYCCILAVPGQDLEFDEFIDWCDDNPDALLEFSEYIEHELTKRKKFAENKKKEVVENN